MWESKAGEAQVQVSSFSIKQTASYWANHFLSALPT